MLHYNPAYVHHLCVVSDVVLFPLSIVLLLSIHTIGFV